MITASLDDDKAEEIVTIDLHGKCSFADYMVVATGRSSRHVSSLADRLQERLKEQGMAPLSIEGKETCNWVVMDAGDVVVHLFLPEARELYQLEEMWTIPAAAVEHATV